VSPHLIARFNPTIYERSNGTSRHPEKVQMPGTVAAGARQLVISERLHQAGGQTSTVLLDKQSFDNRDEGSLELRDRGERGGESGRSRVLVGDRQ
jgi:hypothetical protein